MPVQHFGNDHAAGNPRSTISDLQEYYRSCAVIAGNKPAESRVERYARHDRYEPGHNEDCNRHFELICCEPAGKCEQKSGTKARLKDAIFARNKRDVADPAKAANQPTRDGGTSWHITERPKRNGSQEAKQQVKCNIDQVAAPFP